MHLISSDRPGLHVLWLLQFAELAFAVQTLDCRSQDYLKEGDNQAEDQPDVDHLHVRSGRQLHYLAGEDGGHHQHDGQVHGDGVAKQALVKEDGDKGDEEQEDGGKVGGQQLCGNLPLQHNRHDHQLLALDQGQILDGEHGQVCLIWQKSREVLGNAFCIHHPHLVNAK